MKKTFQGNRKDVAEEVKKKIEDSGSEFDDIDVIVEIIYSDN